MNKRFKSQAQGGFTLIELIVVIVILGILAATALPKFANLSGDARFASVNATKGALASASAIVHGQALVKSAVGSQSIKVEGTDIALTTGGYPTTDSITLAANIDTTGDFTALRTVGAATDTQPAVAANQVVLVPKAIAGTTTATKCYITYTVETAKTDAPVVAVNGNVDACQ